jgi:hypothetical protein
MESKRYEIHIIGGDRHFSILSITLLAKSWPTAAKKSTRVNQLKECYKMEQNSAGNAISLRKHHAMLSN